MEDGADPRPPKRTAIACDNCRKRKRRCNGTKPQCRLCEHLHIDCRYQEATTPAVDDDGSTSTQLVQRLERLERYLQQPLLTPPATQQVDFLRANTGDQIAHGHHVQAEHPPLLQGQAASPAVSHSATALSAEEQSILHPENEARENTMTIPLGHSTTTSSLLHMSQTSALLGQYPPELFFRAEQRRSIPPELSLNLFTATNNTGLPFERHTTDPLVERFFSLVNTRHPVLDHAEFLSTYESFLNQPPADSISYALCLVVLALAEAASQQPDTSVPSWHPGVEYFTPAVRILIQNALCSFGTDLTLPRGLYLAALYYSYAMRPLLAWKLVHMASTNIQHLWVRYQREAGQLTNTPEHQFAIRLMWAIFVLECDIIAEYHLPRSGIEHVVENLPFPQCGSPTERHMLFWLADLSSRVLLNRVHHTMYSAPTGNTGRNAYGSGTGSVSEPSRQAVSSYIKISEELRRQLETWYEYLPPSIKPDLEDRHPTADETTLILRYHASGDIISRPFVFHVCALADGPQPPDFVLENCKMCIDHCHKYLEIFDNRIVLPSGSTEIVLHSALACMIILATASLSPLLKHLVSDLDELLQKVSVQLERWAFPGSSIKSMLTIAKTLIMKRAMMQDLYD